MIMFSRRAPSTLASFALMLAALAIPLPHAQAQAQGQSQTPEWIWHPNQGKPPGDTEVRFFRKSWVIDTLPSAAILQATADNNVTVFINGKQVANSDRWETAAVADVTRRLKVGTNWIAARAANEGGAAAFIAKLEFRASDGKKSALVTDPTWRTGVNESPDWKTGDDDASWTQAASLGKVGVQPWGNPFGARQATAAETLTVLPGFKVDLIRSAQPGEGSWISMAIDHRGRLIVSPQEDSSPLLRFTLAKDGSVENVEAIPAPVRQAMGMVYAHDSLYLTAHGPQGTGLYRLVDDNKNDQFEPNEVHFLKTLKGEGEHGYHGVVAGPDGMIYVMDGNHTKVPDGLSPNSPHQHYAEDHLLPRQWDANGHAVGILAPGGYIARTDAEGKTWELMLAGFRNSYDFDFNAEGEIFTFDSDMEWDWGMPWYRPIRVIHCVTGGEYGWRSGTGKWPSHYPDSLPAAVDVGIGSPTGVKFGTKSKYPAKYQKALFAMDWSYGRILAVHLKPDGATYSGGFEDFVRGKPLNVTDMEFGNDGAMYFATGGRGTQSGLYRVSYVGAVAQEPAPSPQEAKALADAKEARELRHKLESFMGHRDAKAVEFLWPHLNSPDRWIRFAARIALESQDPATWAEKALSEERVEASITALLALARVGDAGLQRDIFMSLKRLADQRLTEDQMLAALRLLGVTFTRMGKPDAEIRGAIADALSTMYPSKSLRLNEELSMLLIYLEAPDVVGKTLALLDAAPTLEEQVHYVFHLRTLKEGWTLEQRKQYFHWLNRVGAGGAHPPQLLQWFKEAGREYSNGASFNKFISNFRKDAVATLSPSEKEALKGIITGQAVVSAPAATNRKQVQEWKVEDVVGDLEKIGQHRSFAKGKTAFTDAQCIACHRFGSDGGSVGPDLTAVGSRFARRDLLENILLPSKVVSDQYQNTTFTLKNGDDISGRTIDETPEKYVVVTNPLTGEQKDIKKSDVASTAAAKLSPMPEGLVNILTKDEILDLIAYLESAGKENSEAFK